MHDPAVEALFAVANDSFQALARAYADAARELQACPLGREDMVDLTAFTAALGQAKAAARHYRSRATGDDVLEATWFLAQTAYVEGSIYQERNTQRNVKSKRRVSVAADALAASACYRQALALLGDPPIAPDLAAEIHFDLGLMTSDIDLSPARLNRALESYEQVLSLDPDDALADQARQQMENIRRVLARR